MRAATFPALSAVLAAVFVTACTVQTAGSPAASPAVSKPVPDVKILNGSGDIATMDDFDTPARPVALQPGQTAYAGLMWRNTTDIGSAAVNAPYVRIRAKREAPPVTITPELDLGTTGKLAVRPWTKGPAR